MRGGWMRPGPALALSFAMGACLNVPIVDVADTEDGTGSTSTTVSSSTPPTHADLDALRELLTVRMEPYAHYGIVDARWGLTPAR